MQNPVFSITDATRHYLAYVPWRTILDWRREEIRAGRRHKGSQLKPYAYATRTKSAYTYLRKGDIIWIFTIPYYGSYGSFPSLNAMLVVEDKADRKAEESRRGEIPDYFHTGEAQRQWRYIFLGGQQFSRYFPINNCLELLLPLLSEQSARRLNSRRHQGYGYLGMAFQHARKLSPEEGRRFWAFQQDLDKQKTLFISYRHRENPEVVEQLARELLQGRVNCWLDLNRIPRGLADEAPEARGFFKEELLSAVAECDGLLALESEAYWQSYWTGLEYGAALGLAKAGQGFRFIEADLGSLASEKERGRLIEKISKPWPFPVIAEN